MKLALIISAGVFLLSGCSSTIRLTSVDEANQKVGGGSATLSLRSDKEYDARAIDIGRDSTRFIERDTDSIRRLPTRSIRSIRLTHRGGGALEGVMFGGLGGGVAGLLIFSGYSRGGDEGMGRGLGILSMTVLGAAGGLVAGIIKGHDYTFIFPDDHETMVKPKENGP